MIITYWLFLSRHICCFFRNIYQLFPKLTSFDLALPSYCSGLVAGVFTATSCGIQRYRRQNDWVNPLIAGAVAGAAVAAGTRSWTQVVGMAGLVSAFSVAADYSKTF